MKKILKILSEIFILLAIGAISSFLVMFFNMPVSASVIAIMILFCLLLTKILKESHIKTTGDFLSKNLIFFFTPAAVGIIEEYKYIKDHILPFFIICAFVTVVILITTALSVSILEKKINNGKDID